MAREVRVAILGDSRDFSRAVSSANHDAGRLEGSFRRAGGGIATLAKGAVLGAGALVVGAAALGKSFVDAATESKKVTAQTDAVIKSMGNSAGVTAKQVADLSTKLSLKSGIDDELIQSGSNVMLTFAQVRNEVGKGNDVFTRANAAALDMSVALKKDMAGSAMLVGKALNDPIRGLTALRRSGIQFTKSQEDQIKAMVAVGDVAGAQKIMLAELEKQFGGSAAAQATAGEKLAVAWDNVKETLGTKLLPVVEKAATWLAATLPGAIESLSNVLGPMAKKFSEFWGALTSGFSGDGGTSIQRFGSTVREVLEDLVAGFRVVVAEVREHWPEIQRVIQSVMETVSAIISGAVTVITTLWNNFGDNILSFVERVWPSIQQIIGGAMEFIRGIIQVVTSLIQGDWSGVWEGIKLIVSGAWSAIQGIVKGALELIRMIVGAALEVLGSAFKAAWNGIVDFIRGVPGRILGALGSLGSLLYNAGRDLLGGLTNGITSAVASLFDLVRGLPGRILNALGSLGSLLYDIGRDLLNGLIRGITSKIESVKNTLTGLTGKLTSWKGPPEKDAGLLVGSGHLLMEGFIRGIAERSGAVKQALSGVTSMIENMAAPQMAPMQMATVSRGNPGVSGSAAMGGDMTITINMPPGSDGQDVVEAIRRYEWSNGSSWRG